MPAFIYSIHQYLFTLAVCLNSSTSYISNTRIILMILSCPTTVKEISQLLSSDGGILTKINSLKNSSWSTHMLVATEEICSHKDCTESREEGAPAPRVLLGRGTILGLLSQPCIPVWPAVPMAGRCSEPFFVVCGSCCLLGRVSLT